MRWQEKADIQSTRGVNVLLLEGQHGKHDQKMYLGAKAARLEASEKIGSSVLEYQGNGISQQPERLRKQMLSRASIRKTTLSTLCFQFYEILPYPNI